VGIFNVDYTHNSWCVFVVVDVADVIDLGPITAFHVFTLGTDMLGWHRVPTGLVIQPHFGWMAKTVPKPVQAYQVGS